MKPLTFVSSLAIPAFLACASTSTPEPSAAAPADGASTAPREADARAQLDAITSAWSQFSFSFGRCPQGIDDLVHPPGGEPLLPSTPVDPWGHPFAFMPAVEGTPAQIVSAGADGELLTDDDLRARATCNEP